MSKPLTDGINALITYANGVTGQSDQTLSDAVATLADGYGGGGGSTTLILGAIRPDAELVKSYTFDQMMVADMEIAIPNYSTSATVLKASQTLGTATVDFNNYDYFATQRLLTRPVYNVATKGKGRMEYSFTCQCADIITIKPNSFVAFDGTKYTSRNTVVISNNYSRHVYFSSSNNLNVYTAIAYGVYLTPQALSLSNNTLTMKSPVLGMRANATYFSQTYWDAMTDARIEYVIDLYRAPRGNLNYDGWGSQMQAMHILDCINNNDGTLT